MPDHALIHDPSTALRSTRLRWLLTLLITSPLPFIVLPITGSDWLTQQPGSSASNAMLLSALIAGGLLLLGLFTRNQMYKANWRGEAVTPAGYLKGNTLLFAAVALAAASLMLISIVTGFPAPTFAAAPLLVGLLIFNFPTGKPMQPTPPRLGTEHGDRL